ncbi:hypothetical protein Ssi03_04140 [Sphaerisporangium siamense]|nr:hypothetical protein Ssi03_04140 [Sphaerisporangium siamense]
MAAWGALARRLSGTAPYRFAGLEPEAGDAAESGADVRHPGVRTVFGLATCVAAGHGEAAPRGELGCGLWSVR